jgi:hypothetical protein
MCHEHIQALTEETRVLHTDLCQALQGTWTLSVTRLPAGNQPDKHLRVDWIVSDYLLLRSSLGAEGLARAVADNLAEKLVREFQTLLQEVRGAKQ